MKLSIIIPVYYNEQNLQPLYENIKTEFIDKINYEYEIIMVNDGSRDNSWEVMQKLADIDCNIRIFSLSKNFGSHAAILCGLQKATGDCAVIKAADLQEPTELIISMVEKWRQGFNVVLAVRTEREESRRQKMFADAYYDMVRKWALPTMPKGGFDIYLIDRKVINVLNELDEKNSALTGQILWSGFRTACVPYVRKARAIGKSRWTLRKKIRLVMDTLFSFTSLPISIIMGFGSACFIGSMIWALVEFIAKIMGLIEVSGFTTLFIFNLFSFGIIMITIGIIGNYLWRTFDASRNRPPYIIEDEGKEHTDIRNI